ASAVAFSAGITRTTQLNHSEILVYDRIFTNIGSGYDSSTGRFKCPNSGIYVFQMHSVSNQGKHVWTELYHNGYYICSMYGHASGDYASGGNSVVLHLSRGDEVFVQAVSANQGASTNIYGATDEVYSTFSGYLVSPVFEEYAINERAAWGNQLEFILTCVGFAVGLGNVWRFPYLAFKNGGGLGYAMVIVSALIALYYDVVIAWCLYYFFASWTTHLPWQDCDKTWNTCECQDGNQNFSLVDPWQGRRNSCRKQRVLGVTSKFEETGGVKWDVTLCNLLAWTIVFIVLSKGIKSLGKVVYFTATFPYILLTALLIRGLTLEGHYDGIMYYLTPDFSKLTDAQVWSDAAVQIFYSLSACSGGLIAMASYNKFNNNCLRDAFLVPIINCLTSFYAGFVIFSVLGFMAHAKGVPVDEVAKGGPGLTFVVYPEGLAQMPAAPVWSFLFFFMMATLGFSSQFSIVETVITGLIDEFSYFSKTTFRRIGFRFCICAIGFLLGLPMTTRGGVYMLNVVDHFVGGFPLLFVGLFELVSINYIYGFWRYKRDIEMMLGSGIAVQICFFYFGTAWMLVSPLALLAVICFTAYQTEPYTDNGYVYPDVAQALGWLIVLAPLICIPCWFVFYSCKNGLWKLCVQLNFHQEDWGPALEENRTGRYAKNVNTHEMNDYDSPAGNAYPTKDAINNGYTVDIPNNGVMTETYDPAPMNGMKNPAYIEDDTDKTKF
ncbi:hypothetical protein FSP39_000641, partial [Pinctada imbricata]